MGFLLRHYDAHEVAMDQPAGQQPPPGSAAAGAAGEGHLDQETLARLRRDGQAALAREFLRHRHRLRRMIEVRLDRRLAGRVDPSEVLEQTFLEAARQLDQYLAQAPMPLFLWLRYLTGQRILALHRQLLGAEAAVSSQTADGRAGRPQADSASLSMHLAAQIGRGASTPARQELSARLAELLELLDPWDREILALRHFEQLSNQEAAEELGLSPAAASHRYIQALEQLGALLKTLPGFHR